MQVLAARIEDGLPRCDREHEHDVDQALGRQISCARCAESVVDEAGCCPLCGAVTVAPGRWVADYAPDAT